MTMKNKLLAITSILLLTAASLSAQVLEVVPDLVGEVTHKTPHIGMTYSGSTGLVTIPVPDFQEQKKIGFTYKSGIFKQDLNINGVTTKTEKNQGLAAVRYNISPELEVNVTHLRYERSSTPYQTGLNFKEDATSLGMKYSSHHGEKSICFGFNFAPMSAEELNKADIEQIEMMRNIYMTISEPITKSCTGYLNVTSAFTKDQELTFSNGTTQKVNRKDILVGAFGLEYKMADAATAFCEAKFGNYRDIFEENSVRHRIHAGFRFGMDSIQGEILGLNLTEDNPVACFGINMGF
jgi:hypothetical protein